MGLFGKKKEQNNTPVEKKENSSISDEMKIILAAREEEKQDKILKAEERNQAQKEADKKFLQIEEQSAQAAERVLTEVAPKGMTFFMLCDEVPFDAAPERKATSSSAVMSEVLSRTIPRFSYIREPAKSIQLRSRRSKMTEENSLTSLLTGEPRSRSQEAASRFRQILTKTHQSLSEDLRFYLMPKALTMQQIRHARVWLQQAIPERSPCFASTENTATSLSISAW